MNTKKELEEILDKITSSPFNLQELSQLYFKAKAKVFANEQGITETEGLISITIFMEGYARTKTYLSQKELTDLTDQELEILLNFSDEASVNFDYLTELFSDGEDGRMSAVFSSKSNEQRQEELKQLRENVIREQVERKFRQDNNNDSKKQKNTKINEEINTLFNKFKEIGK